MQFSDQRPCGPLGDARGDQPPLAYPAALRALGGCAVRVVALLCQRRMHLPTRWLRTRLRFADGTSAPVYRETVIDYGAAPACCVLVVTFTLRWVHGWGHAAFRAESLLNTVLFAGFPGLVSKLWLASDSLERYRGVYEWDGPERADRYARALWRVLAQALADRGVEVEYGSELVSARDSPDAARAVLRTRGRTSEADFAFIAGCDGPASTVRSLSGIGWPGAPCPVEILLADVELAGDLADDRTPVSPSATVPRG